MNNDLISRSKAIEELGFLKHIGYDNSGVMKLQNMEIQRCISVIEDMPAAATDPRPKGKWTDESQESLKCSACGLRVYKPFIGGFPTERTKHYWPNYCAFCGADMRKEGEP